MKRVKIYKAEIVNVKKGKKVTRVIKDKRKEFIKETGVMDRTLEQYEVNEYDATIRGGLFMEEVIPEKRTRKTKEKKVLETEKTESN